MTDKAVIPDQQQQYGQNASKYESVRGPVFQYHELYTVLSQLPDLQGKDVLDLGCGTGVYCRQMKSLGASRVTGVDISIDMLNLARSHEKDGCTVIDYHQQDVLRWVPDHCYDLVFSAFTFNCVSNRDELKKLIDKTRHSLAANGRLVLVLDMLGNRRAEDYGSTSCIYQFYHTAPVAPYDSFRLTLKSDADSPLMDIFVTHIDHRELYHLLTEAGFNSIQFQLPMFCPEAWSYISLQDIATMAAYPFFMVVSATRADI